MDSSLHCPSSHQTLAPIQMETSVARLGGPSSPSEATSKVIPKEPPHSKQKEETPLHKTLSSSCQEAFSRDSRLV